MCICVCMCICMCVYDNISVAHIWRDKLHLNENGTIVLANNFRQRVNPKNIA